MIIPNQITIPGIVIGFLFSFINPDTSWLLSLIGIVFGGGFLALMAYGYYLLTKREGMGMGDVKLLAMIGAFLGIEGVVYTLLVGSVVGSISGIAFLLLKKGDSTTKIPFGPFLSLGAVTTLLLREMLSRFYFGMF
jgi:leader peptidase (prepilin peptidase)/N-methyltransferase